MGYKGIAAIAAACFAVTSASAQEIVEITGTAAPRVEPAAPPMIDEAPPEPPKGVAASFRAPPRDVAGAYITPNRDLSPDETTWHVRVALNVAALACRDADEATTAASYNALLANERAALAAASAGLTLRYQAKYGAAGQAKADDAMTRLYNFFAQSPVQAEFCAEAKAVLRDSAAVEPSDFARFTATALPRLEAPFLAFFARHDAYRAALADYDARHAPRVVIAAATPAPVMLAAAIPAGGPGTTAK